eukprot:jgi/Picre1/33387/NNA_008711.t1
MLLAKPREQDRRKLLEHVRNKHLKITLRFDVAVMEEEDHTGHQKSPEDAPRIQLDGQVSTPLLCSDEDPAVVSSEDAEKALQSPNECSVCSEDLEDSDASDEEEADPDDIDTPTNERFWCTQGSHFKSFLMAVLGEEEGNDIGQAGEDMGEYQILDESGNIETEVVRHKPVLSFIYADAKAREKILLCSPGNAIKGCYYCWQNATQITLERNGKTYTRSYMTGFLPNDEAKHCNGISSEEFQASRHSSLIAE